MTVTILLQSAGTGSMLPYLLAMFAIMYFFMIRPQIKRQKNEKKFQTSIKKGEFSQNDNTCIIETSAGRIKFERSAISMEMSKKLNKEVVTK